MDHILELYEQPYDPAEPVVCFDEKTLQLLEDVRPPQYGKINKRDSHYRRKGTANIFVTVEPQGGFRSTRVSAYRKKPDFAKEIKWITELSRYRNARTIHIVMDNLNTHTERSLVETFGEKKARKILDRVTFHYTPAHASWLNMAEIEISVMSRQCLPDGSGITTSYGIASPDGGKCATGTPRPFSGNLPAMMRRKCSGRINWMGY